MTETAKSKSPTIREPGAASQTSGKPLWKTTLRRFPGIVRLHRRYLRIGEQYAYLSRIARERYGRPEPLFDKYQQDYSHDAAPEQERYELILDAVKCFGGIWGDAIDIGCSKGLFTARLATLCNSVLACDISPRACTLTAERCAEFPNVRVKRFDIQRDAINGEYDLVFVMDTLVYVHGRRRVGEAISRLVQSVRPGGMLVFSDVCWPENIENAWWQRWIPEGADHHIRLMSRRGDLRLLHRQFHQQNSTPEHSYMDHMIALFAKLQPTLGTSEST